MARGWRPIAKPFTRLGRRSSVLKCTIVRLPSFASTLTSHALRFHILVGRTLRAGLCGACYAPYTASSAFRSPVFRLTPYPYGHFFTLAPLPAKGYVRQNSSKMTQRRYAVPADSPQVETLIEKIRILPPEKLVEVEDFVDFLRQREADRRLIRSAAKLSEAAFQKVWDNPDDADYDKL